MSDPDPESHENEDFDVRLWMIDLHISEAGQKKVSNNDIADRPLLMKLTSADIADLKLNVGDKR
jgi:hypothetical protein